MPFSMMCAIWASESFCTFRFSAMLGARSPPLPSRPWQFAQVDAKVRLPCAETGFALFCRRPCCWAWGGAARPLVAHSTTNTSTEYDWELESIETKSEPAHPVDELAACETRTRTSRRVA